MKFFNDLAETRVSLNRLPHWQQDGATYFLTYRLADSIPQVVMDEWKARRAEWLLKNPKPWNEVTEQEYHRIFSAEIDTILDRGHGACVLSMKYFRDILIESFDHFEEERYLTHSRVIMPNHVHLLITLGNAAELETGVGSWKKRTARMINGCLGREGAFWQKDYFDRMIRDWKHFANVLRYIRNNSSKANLVKDSSSHWESELAMRILGQPKP